MIVSNRTLPWGSIENIAALVARGRIVHPTATGTPHFRRDDIRLVPIRDLPPLPLGLIWRTADENARIRALAATARQIRATTARPRTATRPASAPQAVSA